MSPAASRHSPAMAVPTPAWVTDARRRRAVGPLFRAGQGDDRERDEQDDGQGGGGRDDRDRGQ